MSLANRLAAELIGAFWLVLGGWALVQLWMFWVAPLVGAAVAGVVYRGVAGEK